MKAFGQACFALLRRFTAARSSLWLLAVMSFLEACLLPISPLIILVPMSLARPENAWNYVLIATTSATLGAILGYILGYFFMSSLQPLMVMIGLSQQFNLAIAWFKQYSLGALFIASIFPIPFKLFTIICGMTKASLVPFCLVTLFARWLHFALVPLGIRFCRPLIVRFAQRQSPQEERCN